MNANTWCTNLVPGSGQVGPTRSLSGSSSVEEPFEEHGSELVNTLRAHAARLFDLPGELDGERVGGKADPALLTEFKVVVQFVDDILGKTVFQIILKEG